MASLVSYDSDNSFPEDDVVILDDDDDWRQQHSPKVPRVEEQPSNGGGLEDEVNSAFDDYGSEYDSGDLREPKLSTFNGEGFQPDLEERELPNSAEIAARPSESNIPSECQSRLPSPDKPDGNHHHQKKNPYALTRNDLNPGMRVFLAAVKTFFTQKVNLKRQKAPLAATTYRKAEERMLCKFICNCMCQCMVIFVTLG